VLGGVIYLCSDLIGLFGHNHCDLETGNVVESGASGVACSGKFAGRVANGGTALEEEECGVGVGFGGH
jgi:hypothetical protein